MKYLTTNQSLYRSKFPLFHIFRWWLEFNFLRRYIYVNKATLLISEIKNCKMSNINHNSCVKLDKLFKTIMWIGCPFWKCGMLPLNSKIGTTLNKYFVTSFEVTGACNNFVICMWFSNTENFSWVFTLGYQIKLLFAFSDPVPQLNK